MQGRENTSSDLMSLRFVIFHINQSICLLKNTNSMQRLLNPPGSAYRSETGGLMEALRVLTVEQSTRFILRSCVVHLILARRSPQLP